MNKKSLVRQTFDDIKSLKFNAELEAEEHLKEMREKSKEFKIFDDELRLAMFEVGQNPNIDLEKAHQHLQPLKDKRTQALLNAGKPEDYVSPHYSCKLCEDTGILKGEKCVCFLQKLQQKLVENSGLKYEILHNFEDSDKKILEENPNLSKAYALAKTYAEKFPDVKIKNFVFMGEVGTGKTFLLECIASSLLSRQFFVVYATAFNLQNTMIKSLTANAFDRELLMSPLLECDLLIVDDLGSEPIIRNVSATSLFSILNEREAKNKATLISTNLSFKDIAERYGDRLFSRIFNQRKTKVICFTGKDLRINLK